MGVFRKEKGGEVPFQFRLNVNVQIRITEKSDCAFLLRDISFYQLICKMFNRLFDILNLGRLPKVTTMQSDRQLQNETGFLHPSKEKQSRLFILCMHKLIWLHGSD